jgi:hypothetical protein
MNVPVIATAASVVGSVVVLLFLHRFVGFRDRVEAAPGDAVDQSMRARDFEAVGELEGKIETLSALTQRLSEQLAEREVADEARWRLLQGARKEIRDLSDLVFRSRLELDQKLWNVVESRRYRERDRERIRERDIGEARMHSSRDPRLSTVR